MWRGEFNATSIQIIQGSNPLRRLILGLTGGQSFHGQLDDARAEQSLSTTAEGQLLSPEGETLLQGHQRIVFRKIVWCATDRGGSA
jgi:hypothetical protein